MRARSPPRPVRGISWRRACLARGGEVRAFEMNAEDARYALHDGVAHGGDRRAHHRDIVADQRRQQPGSAEAAMRLGDAPQGVDGRRVVEQHAATTVDLYVDEAGQQRLSAEITRFAVRRQRAGIADHRDAAVLDHHRETGAQGIAGEHAGVDQRHPPPLAGEGRGGGVDGRVCRHRFGHCRRLTPSPSPCSGAAARRD